MKGLLMKDWGLMKRQGRFFLVIFALSIWMAFMMKDAIFILGYVTFLIPSFALSTISYDEFDNGNAFLFTLPISRKLYVLEKYCFTLILGVASVVLSMGLAMVVSVINKQPIDIPELLVSAPIILAIMMLLESVMLPIQLKFGAEKGRIAILVCVGLMFATGYGISNLLETVGTDLDEVLAFLIGLPLAVVIAGAAVVIVGVLAVSMKVSTVIMEKKEF